MDASDLRYGVETPYLRLWREYRLLDKQELASRAHVTRNTIIAGEQGKPLRLTTVGKLAKALSVTRQQLVYEQPPVHEGQGHDY
jgi:DNA-binding XRE family transcriptional regulator